MSFTNLKESSKKQERKMKSVCGFWPSPDGGFWAGQPPTLLDFDGLLKIEQGVVLFLFDVTGDESIDADYLLRMTASGIGCTEEEMTTVVGLKERQSKAGKTYWSAWLPRGFEYDKLVWIADGANLMLFPVDQKDEDDPVVRLNVTPPSEDGAGNLKAGNPFANAGSAGPKVAPVAKEKPASTVAAPPPAPGPETEDDDGVPF